MKKIINIIKRFFSHNNNDLSVSLNQKITSKNQRLNIIDNHLGGSLNMNIPEPNEVFVNEFVELIEEKYINLIPDNHKNIFIDLFNKCFKPYFIGMTFYDITGEVMCSMIETEMRHKKGPKKGELLSRTTIKNKMNILIIIWDLAIEHFRWTFKIGNAPKYAIKKLKFSALQSKYKETVYQFDEFMKLLNTVDIFYKPHVEMMILTGLMPSELSSIKKEDIVKNVVIKIGNKDILKNKKRCRNIPITKKISDIIQVSLNQNAPDNPYVFQMKNGRNFDSNKFRNIIQKAFKKSGIQYKTPYMFRHSFAAWSLVIGIDLLRVGHLMGHTSTKMFYEIYGNFIKGLEKDRNKILEYMGEDFL